MSQPFMFPSISSIFFSARSIWSWRFFSMFVLFLGWLGGCSSYFCIRRVPDTSHTPRIISSLVEIPQNGIQHGSFLEVPPKCPNLSCFPLFLPSSFQQEAFGRDFFSMFVLFLGWLGGCSNYFFIRWVLDTSHTLRIISSLVEIPQNGIQHGSFLEVPPKCPNLSCFPLFLPSSFQQEVFGCECLFHVCSVSGLVGWLWQLNSYSKSPDISHTPKVFSCVEISHTVGWNGNERQGARSVWFGCHWFFHIFRFSFHVSPISFLYLNLNLS